jgi:ADP-ribose pyrophosphatase
MYPTPGFVTERMIVYVADRLRPDPTPGDEDERISTRLFPLAELLGWIRNGRIVDAKSVAGILFYCRFSQK